MRRTSSRLRANGYYEANKESDAYCPSKISYRETPVKVFKKRDGSNCNLPHLAKSATKTFSYTPPVPVAQPPIPSSQPYVSYPAFAHDTMRLHYLMSEGPSRRPPIKNNASSTRTAGTISSSHTTCTYSIINGPRKKDSARSSAISSASFSPRISSRMKKACGLLFLFILTSLCVWFLFPMLTSFVDFNLLKFLHHQPNTHLDDAEEIMELMKNPDMQAMKRWLNYHIEEQGVFLLEDKGSGMSNFALELQGARVITSRCSQTYRGSREFLTLFGYRDYTVNVSPRTVIQGLAPLLPGRCWSFPGARGTLAISLSHPIMITHVTVDHVSRYNTPTGSNKAAPKTFQVYGMGDISGKRTLLGTFDYNMGGESSQTFQLPNPTDDIYSGVEMHVLSNWGQAEYTCIYRFRVHGKIAST